MTPPPIECFFIISTAIILLLVLFIKEINTMEKQLRCMNATVYSRMLDGYRVVFLRSYDTFVLVYCASANALCISPDYDCSFTTMKHVRAFLQDYIDLNVSTPDLRKKIKNMSFANEYRLIEVDGRELSAYTCSQFQINSMFWRSKAYNLQ